jgi:membrane peptidoglycan carboxypeptidase
MSGSGPIRAQELDVPVPRRAYAAEASDQADSSPSLLDLLLEPATPAPDTPPPNTPPPNTPPPNTPGSARPPVGDTGATVPRELSTWRPEPDRGEPIPGPADSAQSQAVWFWLWGPLLVAVVIVAYLAGMASAPVVLPSPIEANPATILDVEGRPVATVEPPTPAEQLPANELPDLLLRAVVAVQDPGYFSRHGLSAADLLAAGAADLVQVRRRGTTIEERYARQVGVATGSLVPSLRETSVAVRLSQQLSRRALLIRYVNGMYFDNGVYGVAAASRFYFGVPVTSLDAARIALLAGVADDPSHHNPLTAPAAAVAAQRSALTAMRAAGLLSVPQADAAARAPLDIRAHRQIERPSAAPDFSALVESSLLSRFGDDAVYGQNLQVTTPIDLDLQAALDDNVRRLVPAANPAVLAVGTDPRTGDIRALMARGTPGGAAQVLFDPRPLGSLAADLPPRVGDGASASVGDVAAAAGAIVSGGVRHDLRSVTTVARPATPGRDATVIDAADPLPAGQPVLAPDAATAMTAAARSAAREPGPDGTRLPFALAGMSGNAGPDSWYVGCAPELCLTVWVGPQGPAAVTSESPTDRSVLARQIVTSTFTSYLAAVPGRINVPDLPAPPVAPHPPVRLVRPATTPNTAPPTPPPATPAPTAAPTPTAHPSAQPTPEPSASALPSASPSPSGGPPHGRNGRPVAGGPPPGKA